MRRPSEAGAPSPDAPRRPAPATPARAAAVDVSPDDDIRRQAAADRSAPGQQDLLNERQPVE